MNIDAILSELSSARVDYLLIGGVNFLLRHTPELTFDVDIWVRDDPKNLAQLNIALKLMGAEWGPIEIFWKPVPTDPRWLREQTVFCLTTRHGALDIFREVKGLEGKYNECHNASFSARTGSGIPYRGLSDQHMLDCQTALPPGEQNQKRIATLKKALSQPN